MKRFIILLALGLTASTAMADIVVKTSKTVGPMKIMNAVNNGPDKTNGDQVRDNFLSYKDCDIPYARTHDSNFSTSYGGPHTIDITAIFPDFSKNVNDPKSYDFTFTDEYLSTMQEAGTKVFYRLGQSIEHGSKKYGIMPPADNMKWAQICEHIIRHFTEGWADGYKWDIEYWEIWNEPDLDSENEAWKRNPRTWGGSPEQFFKFYEVAANHLNKCFPRLKIGGPALAGNEQWADQFLAYMAAHKVDLDFFSWHIYSTQPTEIAAKSERMRKLMDKHGYTQAESILNEWNYVKGWTDEYQYSVMAMNSLMGAAFIAATFNLCNKTPLDMLMYYDARVFTVFNGMFDYYTFAPKEGYYPFYAWAKLRKLGTEIEATSDDEEVSATAATNGKGKTAVFVSRFTPDNNVVASKWVNIKVEGLSSDAELIGHITDSNHMYTEVPVHVVDGVIRVNLEPRSFIMIEIR
ncbi:MAG: hypothetical protein Q4E55_08570 [Bacteroidales bacterium]|nr:hypothetical protein [Bacteroidales bacterium]